MRERPDVHVAESRVRCPYCHDSIGDEVEDWVACEGCLARHHAQCWRESGRCASCSKRRVLVRPKAMTIAFVGAAAGLSGLLTRFILDLGPDGQKLALRVVVFFALLGAVNFIAQCGAIL